MDKITFGRAEDCDIVIEDKYKIVSRYHGYLLIAGHKVYIVDDNSKNGIQVNGKRINGKALLSPGDSVKIANKYSLDWQDYVEIDSDETIRNYDETSRYDASIYDSSVHPQHEQRPLVDIPSKIEINQNYAEVYRNGEEGADWKVPLKRNVGDNVGNAVGKTLGCIISIVIILAFIGIMMSLFN